MALEQMFDIPPPPYLSKLTHKRSENTYQRHTPFEPIDDLNSGWMWTSDPAEICFQRRHATKTPTWIWHGAIACVLNRQITNRQPAV